MSRSKKTAVDVEINTEKSFVSRWSRLKHETRQGINKTSAETASVVIDLSDEDGKPPAKILTDADMPDIEAMTADSDYTDFLSPGVSEGLRKLALRKLFRSEVFNICDGLDDYDDDYTQFKHLGSIVTSDMRHQIELKAQRMAEQLLQEKQQLADNDGMNDLVIDDKDSADKNKISTCNQDISKTRLDASQTPIAADTTTKNNTAKNRAFNASPTVETGTNAGIKINLHKSDDNTEPGT